MSEHLLGDSQLIVNDKNTTQLFFRSVKQASFRTAKLKNLGSDEVVIQTLFSGISRGTERLVWNGLVPLSQRQLMRCPHQIGDFSFPISYGYSSVGKVLETGSKADKHKTGDLVFVLHPHHTQFIVAQKWLNPIPDNIPPARAVLAANAETALNAVWDAEIKNGNKIAVIGAGVVGLLIAHQVRKLTGRSVLVVDVHENKMDLATEIGGEFQTPIEMKNSGKEFDIIFNTSASASGLQLALDHAKFEGRIVEVSWYGDKPVEISLGGNFHSRRLQIISSQVGSISPVKRNEISYAERFQMALSKLEHPMLDRLLHPHVRFENLPDQLPQIFDPNADALCPLISYIDTE